jgi:hypothetical protein
MVYFIVRDAVVSEVPADDADMKKEPRPKPEPSVILIHFS